MDTNNTVKKALSFTKGLTNSPSDFISSDDELTESAGMIMKNGEMVPIQKPTLVLDTDKGELKFVHKTADQEMWVFFDKSAGQMSVYDNTDADNGEFTQTIKLESFISCANVANTLVITTNKGLLYMLLEKGKYKVLGYGLPDYEFLPRFTESSNIGDYKDINWTLMPSNPTSSSAFSKRKTGQINLYKSSRAIKTDSSNYLRVSYTLLPSIILSGRAK